MQGIVPHPELHAPVLSILALELERVEQCFSEQLNLDLPPVQKLCRYIERYRGKMLRPTMTILCGLAASANVIAEVEPNQPELTPTSPTDLGAMHRCIGHSHRVVAAVCEMVHMATLVHDDVLDEADMRRRGATVNYLHGNEAAVLLGDYLISNSFHLCSTLGRPELNERIGAVTNSMCAGELLQLHHRGDWSIDIPTYMEIINRKTASLIGLCCELGAYECGAEQQLAEAMGQYGRKLGMAFQIQDDLLDLIGVEEEVGKSLGKDLEKTKLTLPIILYFQEATANERENMLHLLSDNISEDSRQLVRATLLNSAAVEHAQQEANDLVESARVELKKIHPSPARQLLEDLAVAVVARRY